MQGYDAVSETERMWAGEGIATFNEGLRYSPGYEDGKLIELPAKRNLWYVLPTRRYAIYFKWYCP